MPNRFDISKINDIDEEEQLPSNDEFDNEIDLEDNEDEEPDCFFCNATGEGYTPDSRCAYCFGRGTIKKKHF